jgi:thymidylate synthase (FAD)
MNVDYIEHLGSDLTVVNAARVSFHKESEWLAVECDTDPDPAGRGYTYIESILKPEDAKLISYLATHGHWTPFAHPQITLRIKAPIFVARQLYKHKIGFVENEVSRRYVDDTPEFFLPEEWRGRPTNGAKQGSSDETVKTMKFNGQTQAWNGEVSHFVKTHFEAAKSLYIDMIEAGIAPEQCRMVLPQAMYTEWYWTASLASYARLCKQRLDPHAQAETRDVAQQISNIIQPLYPVSWEALTN